VVRDGCTYFSQDANALLLHPHTPYIILSVGGLHPCRSLPSFVLFVMHIGLGLWSDIASPLSSLAALVSGST
jgi:hypothetical protein